MRNCLSRSSWQMRYRASNLEIQIPQDPTATPVLCHIPGDAGSQGRSPGSRVAMPSQHAAWSSVVQFCTQGGGTSAAWLPSPSPKRALLENVTGASRVACFYLVLLRIALLITRPDRHRRGLSPDLGIRGPPTKTGYPPPQIRTTSLRGSNIGSWSSTQTMRDGIASRVGHITQPNSKTVVIAG